jgi:hypothetical protein
LHIDWWQYCKTFHCFKPPLDKATDLLSDYGNLTSRDIQGIKPGDNSAWQRTAYVEVIHSCQLQSRLLASPRKRLRKIILLACTAWKSSLTYDPRLGVYRLTPNPKHDIVRIRPHGRLRSHLNYAAQVHLIHSHRLADARSRQA